MIGIHRKERSGLDYALFSAFPKKSSMWPYPKIVAHRGGGKLAPENTLAAMQCGLQHGFHAVEFDVMLSKDDVPVLMHDPELGRTVRGTGSIADFTAQQLRTMDAGAWFSEKFMGEPVPTLKQVVEYCKQNRIWMNVEIKPVPGREARTGQVVAYELRRLFSEEIAASHADVALLPLISSFSWDALREAQAAAPDLPRGYLVEAMGPDWQERLTTLQAVALHANHKYLLPEKIQAVKQAGYGLFCYTVNDPARAKEILSWGVDAFCTDRIDLIGPDFHPG